TAIVVGATISIPAPGNLINAALDGGTIQFFVDGSGTATCTDNVTAGVLGLYTCSIPAGLVVGNHTVTATYSGNTNYSGSGATLTGGVTVQKLTLPSFDLVVSAPSRVYTQTGTSFTATLNGV